MHVLLRALTCLVVVVMLGGLPGCGGPRGYKVTGKLTQDGAPDTVSDKGVIQMNLVPVDARTGAKVYPVRTKRVGTFVIENAGDGAGPAAGKYCVNVQVTDPYPGMDTLEQKFFGQHAPLV